MSDYETRFGAIGRLYGTAGLARIRAGHICVIGLGGVGSWVVEALARSGIGALTLVDMDEVCLSNVNRQIHALDGNIGRSKAAVLAERVGQIAPECELTTEEVFFTEATADRLLKPAYDYIIDAIDATRLKCYLIAEARKRGLNIITCGGAGGCIDPSRVKICDLARTINDPLLLQVRKRLRQKYGFPDLSGRSSRLTAFTQTSCPSSRCLTAPLAASARWRRLSTKLRDWLRFGDLPDRNRWVFWRPRWSSESLSLRINSHLL